MTADPWTPEEIDYVERVNAMREERPDFAASRAIATIRALQRQCSEVRAEMERYAYERNVLFAEITELKTPSGYWTADGDSVEFEHLGSNDYAVDAEGLERYMNQFYPDEGEEVTFTPFHQLPDEQYIVRWLPDPEDPDMRRVRLERVEQSQHPIGDLREEEV